MPVDKIFLWEIFCHYLWRLELIEVSCPWFSLILFSLCRTSCILELRSFISLVAALFSTVRCSLSFYYDLLCFITSADLHNSSYSVFAVSSILTFSFHFAGFSPSYQQLTWKIAYSQPPCISTPSAGLDLCLPSPELTVYYVKARWAIQKNKWSLYLGRSGIKWHLVQLILHVLKRC